MIRQLAAAHASGSPAGFSNSVNHFTSTRRSPIVLKGCSNGKVPTAGGARDHASVVKIPPTGIPLEDIERHALVEALKMSNWVQKDAAELLAISPRVMNYKIKTLGIEFPRGRRAAPLQPPVQVAAAS